MIYSAWRPDRGGYDYYESAERVGMGDDLPVPQLTPVSAIGVPSTDVGRTPRGELRTAGSGPLPRGMVLPLSRDGLSGIDVATGAPLVLAAIAGLIAGYLIGSKR